MKRHFFTVDEDRQILTLRAAGMTHLQISTSTGLVLGSIHSRIGLLKRKGVRSVEDLDNPELQVKRNFTPDDGLVVAELRNAGMSYPDAHRIRAWQHQQAHAYSGRDPYRRK